MYIIEQSAREKKRKSPIRLLRGPQDLFPTILEYKKYKIYIFYILSVPVSLSIMSGKINDYQSAYG